MGARWAPAPPLRRRALGTMARRQAAWSSIVHSASGAERTGIVADLRCGLSFRDCSAPARSFSPFSIIAVRLSRPTRTHVPNETAIDLAGMGGLQPDIAI